MSVRPKDKQVQKFLTWSCNRPQIEPQGLQSRGEGQMRKHRTTKKWTKQAATQVYTCTVMFPSTDTTEMLKQVRYITTRVNVPTVPL